MGTLVDPRLSTFNAVFESSVNADSYDEYEKGLYQQKINNEWPYAPDKYTVQEEATIGKMDWQDIEVRITHILQANTGEKLGDDWRNLIFKDMNHEYSLGRRYLFNDNYWITVNSDIYKYVTSSTIIRRCNNALRFYDDTHTLITEPCIIDYKPTNIAVLTNKNTVDIQEGKIYVTCQYNDNTKLLDVNKRFIFGKHVYKIIYDEDYFLNQTMDLTSCPLLSFKMQITQKIVGFDDFTNGIAWNDNNVNPSPTPSPTGINYLINAKDNFGDVVDVLQDSSNIKLFNSTVNEGTDNITTFFVNAFKDSVKQSDTFTIAVSSQNTVPSSYFSLSVIDGNTFKITNNQRYDNDKLKILCTDNVDNAVIELDVYLGGEF